MKPETGHVRISYNLHAQEVLWSIATFYKIAPAILLRVIVESVLDAAAEDGDLQRQIAEGARYCRRMGHVPECWLELEGERFEDGPDDSESDAYANNEEAADAALCQSRADYGDEAAEWGERDDTCAFNEERRKAGTHDGKRRECLSSLADAG